MNTSRLNLCYGSDIENWRFTRNALKLHWAKARPSNTNVGCVAHNEACHHKEKSIHGLYREPPEKPQRDPKSGAP